MILLKNAWFLYFLFPAFAVFFKVCRWEWGVFGASPLLISKNLLKILLMGLFIHWALIRPLMSLVLKRTDKITFSVLGFSAVYLAIPLVVLGYWVGEVRTFLQAQEVALSVIPPVFLSLMIYLKEKATWIWSLSLTLMVSYHFFLVSEILGPFRTSIYLLVESPHFEWFRIVYPGIVIALYYRLNWELHLSTLDRLGLRINSVHHSGESSRLP